MKLPANSAGARAAQKKLYEITIGIARIELFLITEEGLLFYGFIFGFIMRSFLISHLLLLLSVVSLTRAQTTFVIPTTTETTTSEPTTTAETTTSEPTTTAETTTETSTDTYETTAETTIVSTSFAETTPWTAPAIFYPFGAIEGDTEIFETGQETYEPVNFSTPFLYFGRKYNSAYVNNNGLITFKYPLPEVYPPYQFPANRDDDYITPLWTELDDVGFGVYSYQQYTSGSVLTRATQDINKYFPRRGFTASWVFVVTWDYVLTFDTNTFDQRAGPRITFQAVLISGDGFSFILMHYGDCAGQPYVVGAGYDTIGSTDYYQIYYNPNDGYSIPTLKTTTNVGVPGRWAFLVNNRTETVIGVQMKLRSFLNLKQTENIEDVLHQIKQQLINHGVSSNFELKLRTVRKIP